MATRRISISVVTRLQDCGDGGYTMYAYNNDDELIADHPRSEAFNPVTKKYEKVELSPDQRNDILNEDDPYRNGYIGSDTIELEVNDDGTIRLAKNLHFHAGQ